MDPKTTDYLMGLFSDTEMSFHGTKFSANQPSLEDMTEKVFEIFQFLLFLLFLSYLFKFFNNKILHLQSITFFC